MIYDPIMTLFFHFIFQLRNGLISLIFLMKHGYLKNSFQELKSRDWQSQNSYIVDVFCETHERKKITYTPNNHTSSSENIYKKKKS